jgi:hypothetical protein
MPLAQCAHLQPAGIDDTRAHRSLRLGEHTDLRATPPTPMRVVAAGCALPALRAEAAMALAGGGAVTVLLPTDLHHGVAQIVGITQDHDRDTRRGLHLPDAWARPLRGRVTGEPQRFSVLGLDLQPEPPGDHRLADHQQGADILLPTAIALSRGSSHRGDRIHNLAACGFLRSIKHPVDGLPSSQVEPPQPFRRLLAQGRCRVPPRAQKEVMDAGPMVCGLHIAVQSGDMPPAPRPSDHEDQQPDVPAMVPVAARGPRAKKLVQGGGNSYAAKYEAMLPKPTVNGSFYTLPSHRWRIASPATAVQHLPPFPPKKSVNLSIKICLCL